MAECSNSIVFGSEEQWAKWKENKCLNFEKASSKSMGGRKVDEKRM
jgi:hypothetical protein